MKFRNNFFETPANTGSFTSSHESQMFLMASRIFPEGFQNLLCSDPSEDSLSMAAIDL